MMNGNSRSSGKVAQLIVKIMFFFIAGFTSSSLYAQADAEQLIDRGYTKYENEEYEAAIRDFEKALELERDNAEIYYLLGASKSILGDKKAAMKHLDKATSLRPDYAAAYYEKGYIYLTDRNAENAIKEFDKVIKHNPSFVQAYVSRGTAKCMMNDKVGANADWQRAKEMGVDYGAYMVCE